MDTILINSVINSSLDMGGPYETAALKRGFGCEAMK
jgi:hypothetical protein